MKAKCTRGFGIITDPETGDEINVEDTFEVSEQVFKRLKDAYSGIEAVSSAKDTSDEETPTKTDNTETETFRCGVAKSDGQPCTREVGSESAKCWQHQDG